MKTAVITGAKGFIGNALCRELIQRKIKVYAIIRENEKIDDMETPYLEIINLDMAHYGKLPECIHEPIDVFFHLAWEGVYGDAIKDCKIQADNLKYTIDLSDILSEMSVKKILFFSTSHTARVLKKDKTIISCIYGAAKLAAEDYLKTFCYKKGIEYNAVLFVNVFGIGDHSTRSTNTLLEKMRNNETLQLINGETLYDWTYIDDAIQGILDVANSGQKYSRYYISSFGARTFNNIIEEAKNAVNSNSECKFDRFQEESVIDFENLKRNTKVMIMHDGLSEREKRDIFQKYIKNTAKWKENLMDIKSKY